MLQVIFFFSFREPDNNRLLATGIINNKNTIESFKEEDKAQILKNEGEELLKIIKKEAVEQPYLLSRFYISSFADLKKYHYYYWFAFPASSLLSYEITDLPKKISEVFNSQQIDSLCNSYIDKLDVYNKGFFFIKQNENSLNVYSIKDGLVSIEGVATGWIFGFADSCGEKFPGWPLRNYLAFLSYHW